MPRGKTQNRKRPCLSPRLSPTVVRSDHLHPLYLFTIIEEMGDRTHLGEFELVVVLALLRLGENAYGVPISREIERQCGREAAFGSVYATLERLQKKGLVSSSLG